MTIGGLLVYIIVATIIINAITLLIKRKKDRKSVDTEGNYFIGSMVIAAFTLTITIIVTLAIYKDCISALLNTKLF